MENQQPGEELAKIRDDANVILYKAEEVAKIDNLDQQARAIEMLAQIKRRAKIVEEKRLEYTKPLNDSLRAINADFKEVLAPLKQAETIVKKGVQLFHDTEQYRLKEEARKQAELEAKLAANKVELDPTSERVAEAEVASAKVAEASVEAPRTVATQSGELRTRKTWKMEIVDPDAVPAEYQSPDEKKIKEAIKNGKREIPGCKIWEETVPIIMS